MRVSGAALLDLRERLRRTRRPEAEAVRDRSQGVPRTRLNAAPQYRTTIDGLGIHFLHARPPHPGPRPSRRCPDTRYRAEHDRGGHFAAVEAPDLLVEDPRTSFFRHLR